MRKGNFAFIFLRFSPSLSHSRLALPLAIPMPERSPKNNGNSSPKVLRVLPQGSNNTNCCGCIFLLLLLCCCCCCYCCGYSLGFVRFCAVPLPFISLNRSAVFGFRFCFYFSFFVRFRFYFGIWPTFLTNYEYYSCSNEVRKPSTRGLSDNLLSPTSTSTSTATARCRSPVGFTTPIPIPHKWQLL